MHNDDMLQSRAVSAEADSLTDDVCENFRQTMSVFKSIGSVGNSDIRPFLAER